MIVKTRPSPAITAISTIIVFVIVCASSFASVAAQTIGTPAKYAILLDTTAGEVLFEKDADTAIAPASMSKLMTVYLAFEAIKEKELQLDDRVIVSDDAWRRWNNQGSTMFLRAKDEVSVLDLLRGIIVLSGNDACVVLAEHIAGTHSLFVEWMNAKAKEIGLTKSHFENANGWPAEGHVMSVRDIATLSYKLSTEFPDLYPLFSEREFLYKDFGSNRYNRNPLLGNFSGADGLKTGHTEEAGYGIAASALQEGRRLVLVVSGLESQGERRREANRLLQFGYRNFENYPLFKAGETVDYASVWLGQEANLPLVLENDMSLVLSRRQRSGMAVKVAFDNPLPAPIRIGQPIGTLTVEIPDRENIKVQLLAGRDVEAIGGFGRIGAAIDYFLFGSAR